jgi:hypothetical protein
MLYHMLLQVTPGELAGSRSQYDDVSFDEFQRLIFTSGSSTSSLDGLNDAQIVKLKVGSVGRMRRMYKNLVEN